jgi:integrase
MKRANGTGTICKLQGNRRKPWAVKLPNGFSEKGNCKYKYLSYHRTKREAERALAVYNEDPYVISRLTLKNAYDEYYAEQEKTKAPKTLHNHRAAIKHLEPIWDVKLTDIDRVMLQRFFSGLDTTPSVINNIRRTLQGVINYAVKLGMMPSSKINILKAVDLSTENENRKNEHKVISKEVREALWKRTDDEMVRIILVYIYTGCRYVELYNLLPENIHEDHIDIIQAKTAAGVRVVPLADRIRAFARDINVPGYSTFLRRFQEILPGYTPHDTRHTLISMLAENETDPRIIKSIVGHSSGRDITDVYTHISLEVKLNVVNSLTI